MGSMAKKLARTQARLARENVGPHKALANKHAGGGQGSDGLPDTVRSPRSMAAPVERGRGRKDSDDAAVAREMAAVTRLLTRYGDDMDLARETRGAAAAAGLAPWDMVLVAIHEEAIDERRTFSVPPLTRAEPGDGGMIVIRMGRFAVADVMPKLPPGGQAKLGAERKRAMRSGGARNSLALFIHDDGYCETVAYELPRAERAQVGEDMLADDAVGASGGYDGA